MSSPCDTQKGKSHLINEETIMPKQITREVPLRIQKYSDREKYYAVLDRDQERHIIAALRFLFASRELVEDLSLLADLHLRFLGEGKDLERDQFLALRDLCGRKNHRFKFKLKLSTEFVEEPGKDRGKEQNRRRLILESMMEKNGEDPLVWCEWMGHIIAASNEKKKRTDGELELLVQELDRQNKALRRGKAALTNRLHSALTKVQELEGQEQDLTELKEENAQLQAALQHYIDQDAERRKVNSSITDMRNRLKKYDEREKQRMVS